MRWSRRKTGRHYLLVRTRTGQIEHSLLKNGDGQAITGYVAACAKAEEIVAERTESQQPA